MKAAHPWHNTALGTVIRWMGSIQLAVPVMALVAVAMAWGTYLESTQDAKVARELVYGSSWFTALMVLVCVSLIFAALSRFPWQRKHVGFLVVHASLVALIAGGFWSMFGRIEGRIALDRGMTSSVIEMSEDQLEVVEHDSGTFRSIDAVSAPSRPRRVSLAGLSVEVVEVWDNVSEKVEVTNNAEQPYRAVQIAFGPVEESHVWIGDEARGEAPVIDGIRIRVLGADVAYEPPHAPPPPAQPGSYAFVVGADRYPLTTDGAEVFPGWKITSIKRFTHASVSAGELHDATDQQENPAVDVLIADGKGTVERHTAFELFPDMALSKTISGGSRSGARLVPVGVAAAHGEETVVVYGQPPELKLAYIAPDGAVSLRDHNGGFPFVADFGSRKLNFINQLSNAKEETTYTKGPKSKDRRPALLVRLGDSLSPLPWKGTLPVDLGGRPGLLRFGPRSVSLPFTLRLDEFRKTDYPGTGMAMAYESSVTVTSDAQPDQTSVISMNNPLKHSGWKVYQSGFQGNSVSIFSVMRDPGLPLTYLASITLCLGILITFYGRGLSWGHPGIPLPFSAKEPSRAAQSGRADVVVPAPLADARGDGPALGGTPGSDSDSGRRAGDAARYVRA